MMPDGRPTTDELLGIAPDWLDGQTVDEYIDAIRHEPFAGSRGTTYTWPRNWTELIGDSVGDCDE